MVVGDSRESCSTSRGVMTHRLRGSVGRDHSYFLMYTMSTLVSNPQWERLPLWPDRHKPKIFTIQSFIWKTCKSCSKESWWSYLHIHFPWEYLAVDLVAAVHRVWALVLPLKTTFSCRLEETPGISLLLGDTSLSISSALAHIIPITSPVNWILLSSFYKWIHLD